MSKYLNVVLKEFTIKAQFEEDAANIFVDSEPNNNDFYKVQTSQNYIDIAPTPNPSKENSMELNLKYLPVRDANVPAILGVISSAQVKNFSQLSIALRLINNIANGTQILDHVSDRFKQIVVRPLVLFFLENCEIFL